MNASNTDLLSQLNAIYEIIDSHALIAKVCDMARELNLRNYYVGAGFVAQSIWNYLSDRPDNYGINDIDLVYFDPDLSYEKEDKVVRQASKLFSDFPLQVDLKNQARVHLWYKGHFGYDIPPYSSVEEAINTWPTTATAIGIRLGEDNNWSIYAPFGLNDVLGKIVRPNKAQITREIYERKVQRWIRYWPDLKVIPWEK